MTANNLAMGRNWHTATSANLKTGADWARWELRWPDGAMVYGVEDSRQEAVAALQRYGFHPKQKETA